jgi:hypothetical protein
MIRRRSTRSAALAALALPLALLLLAPACSDDDEGSSDTTTAEDRTCEAWSGVVTSFEAYEEIDVVDEGLDSVRSYLSDLESALGEFGDAASDQLRPEVEALTSAVGDLEDAVTGDASASAVGEAVDEIDAAWNDLVDTLSTECPSVDAEKA